jgi:hypothetical protein
MVVSDDALRALSTLAGAGLGAGLESLRILANRGLARPEEIDDALGGILEMLADAPSGMQSVIKGQLIPKFREIRRVAEANWTAK